MVELREFSHFRQKAAGNPAPSPFLDYLDGGIHKDQPEFQASGSIR